MRMFLWAPMAGVILALTGCGGTPKPSTFTIEPANYSRAFDSTRDVLREFHFDLARVDARAGVITTEPTESSGLATPWLDYTDTWNDAFEGLMEFERRRVNVRFAPQGTTPSTEVTESPFVDVLASTEPIQVDVTVLVERIYRPGRRPDATGVRLMSYSIDPAAVADGSQPWFVEQNRDDVRLAGRLAAAIERELAKVPRHTAKTDVAGLE